MLLACPKCNTVFRVQRTAIGSGRKVNCGVCKNVWFANPENLIEEKKVFSKSENSKIDKSSSKNAFDPPKPKDIPLKQPLKEQVKSDETTPLISKEINRASEFNKKKNEIKIKRKNFQNVILWFLFGIFLSTCIFGYIGFYHRNYIIAYFPKSLEIYKLVNVELNPNLKNLEIKDFSAQLDDDVLIIKGKIFNNSFLRKLSPKIEITAYNNNEIISVFNAFGENQVIGSKSLNHFRSEIFDYDNISNLNISEFRAIMTNERLVLEAR